MLAARRSFDYRWSSVLRSSFTCTFLLPSFFPRRSRRDSGDGRLFSRQRRRQLCTITARELTMTTSLNGRGGKKFVFSSLENSGLALIEDRTSRINTNPPSSRTFTTISPRAAGSRSKITDRDWIKSLAHEFPPPAPEPVPPPPPPPPLHPPADLDPRFPPHADLLPDHKFPLLYGFSVPPKPPYTNPRYMPAWIETLLTGPFLPPQLRTQPTDTPDTPENLENLLFLLERAWGHKHDLITELITQGKWQHAVWIIRALLEPAFEYPPNASQSVFEGTKYTAFSNTREAPRTTDGAIPSPAIAGRSGLWAVTDKKVKRDIERRRRGFGIVLGSLCGMVLRAAEETPGGDRKDRMGDRHTDLLPTARQILAYCHTADFMPEALYAFDRYPRLHVLRPRILASLADAVWRAQEAMVAEEAARLGVVGEYRGMEVPRARYTLDVWGSGTTDIPTHPDDRPIAYSEREVWLELILTAIIEAGYGNIGVSVIKHMASLSEHEVPHNTWSFVDYIALYPSEYAAKAITHPSTPPSTSSIASQFNLPGHSLHPPPITTHPLTLPDWILPAIADAVVDSTSEGRGLEAMFKTILTHARAHPMRRETLLRLLRHPALTWSKNAEVTEVSAGLIWEFGDRLAATNMYYSSLMLHISADNIVGAMRVWNGGVRRIQASRAAPTVISARYLALLVKHRKLNQAWELVRFKADGTAPVLGRASYRFPAVAPAVLALAVESRRRELYSDVVAEVGKSRREGRMIARATYTSMMNAHLAFGEVELAKQVLLDMREDGIQPDGVNVAVLVRHELERDVEAGFKLAEAEGGGELPRAAWVTVLDYAVRVGDMARMRWVLEKLQIDLQTGVGLETDSFNILLRGVAERDGCREAMVLCHRLHTRGMEVGGRVVGDARSFRTVLHSAVRELLRMKMVEEGELRGIMERVDGDVGVKVKGKGKDPKRKEVEDVITWCWEQMRNSGMEIGDVVKTVRGWLSLKGEKRGSSRKDPGEKPEQGHRKEGPRKEKDGLREGEKGPHRRPGEGRERPKKEGPGKVGGRPGGETAEPKGGSVGLEGDKGSGKSRRPGKRDWGRGGKKSGGK